MSRFPFTSFPTGWYRVGWSDELRRNDVRPLRYFSRDLVLFRTASGRACLLDAHCPHVGAHLGHGGIVVGERIQCPFHGWCMDGNGQCVEIPYSKRIPERARIGDWPLHEVNGVILAYYHPAGRLPDWSVPEFTEYTDPHWTPFRPGARWRIRTHLQELGENGMDKAHFTFLHPQQTRSMRSDSLAEDGVILVHRTFQYYNVFGLAKWLTDEVSGPLDVTLYGMGVAVNRTCVSARIRLYYTFVFFFTPIDDEHTEVTCMLSMKKLGGPLVTKLLLRKAIREGQKTIDQDVPIWENKIYRDQPVLCDGDGPIMQYRRWVRQFYRDDSRSQPIGRATIKA